MMAIQANNLLSGVKVSVNQYQSSLLGRLFHTERKEDDFQHFQGGTVMVDHASGCVFVHHQVFIDMEVTLKGMKKFERSRVIVLLTNLFKTRHFLNIV